MRQLEKDLQMARHIAEKVRKEGGSAWFVGGCVRDKLLGRQSKDIDLEIHGITPEALEGILRELGQPRVMGNSFGIFGLAHYDLDVAMPRKENSREAVDPFVGTQKAAMRRDLTINALMEDVLTGQILDWFSGREDLKNGVIRHVNDRTFAEDPLRVLRAAQFAARFGFSVAEETVRLSRTLDLKGLPRERVWGELEKALLKSERPSVFFETLREMDQLDVWFPEIRALIGVEQEPAFHPEGDVWNHTMLVLDAAAGLRSQAEYPLGFMTAALCHDLGKVTATKTIDGRIRAFGHEEEGLPLTEAFLGRLTRESKLMRYVRNMVQLHMRPNIMAAQNSGVKAVCRMFDQSVEPGDLLLLARADHCSRPDASAYEETEQFLRRNLEIFRQRMAEPGVMGADLIQAGFQPGRDFKEALEFAHRLQVAGVNKDNALRQTLAYLRDKERENQVFG